jgi:hypothetical protein
MAPAACRGSLPRAVACILRGFLPAIYRWTRIWDGCGIWCSYFRSGPSTGRAYPGPVLLSWSKALPDCRSNEGTREPDRSGAHVGAHTYMNACLADNPTMYTS